MKYPKYQSFPRTEPPPEFAQSVADVFADFEQEISTLILEDGLKSDHVMSILRDRLIEIGFVVEGGKERHAKIERPVFFGEQGLPTLKYEVDAYHNEWKCGLEIEAGRAMKGNAFYRDLILATVMVNVQYLIIALPLAYKHNSNNRRISSPDYDKASKIAESLYGHSRMQLPYSLLLVGY